MTQLIVTDSFELFMKRLY